jgi:transglutaminase-like putative cysteine protease
LTLILLQIYIGIDQKNITIKEIYPSPLEYLNIEGNNVAFFECKSSTRIYINCQLVTSEMKLEKSNSIATLTKNDCKAFTRCQQLIQINDEIKNLAKNIVKDEKEPIKQTELLFTWIVEDIRYKKPSSNFGNLIAIRNKRGDCGNMSFLFASLCRALNIPARVIFGWWAIGPGKTGPHAWSECFIENYS